MANRKARRESYKDLPREQRIAMEREAQLKERMLKANVTLHSHYLRRLEVYVPKWAQKTSRFFLRLHRPLEVLFNVWPSKIRRAIQYQPNVHPAFKSLTLLLIYFPVHLVTTILTMLLAWPTAIVGRMLAMPFTKWGTKSFRGLKKEGVLGFVFKVRRGLFRWEVVEDSEWPF